MNCPTIDKLSQYIDNLLPEEEASHIHLHVTNCQDCKRVVEAFQQEAEFLQETLQTPKLPDDFEKLVLDELEPYEQPAKRKKKMWKHSFIAAAVVVLAFGLTATFNPSFAEWIGGLFSTERVDEGLRIASEEGFVIRVNEEATDQGITFKIEDIIADSTRIALSYQILTEAGKTKDSYLEFADKNNEIYAIDKKDNRIEMHSMGWSSSSDDDYGLLELSLKDLHELEEPTVKIHLTRIDGKKGTWQLEIPIDLRESLKSTKTIALSDMETSAHGVALTLKEFRFAPSSNEILYETAFTEEERATVETQIEKLEATLGKDIVTSFSQYGTAIQYHIENGDAKPIYYHNAFLEGNGHPTDVGLLQGTGESWPQFGKNVWSESFIPTKEENLTFVLDGVIKTVPSDFAITIRPEQLKKEPVSFEYEGNYITIKKAQVENEYSLRKSIIPFEKETYFTIKMEGGKEAQASELGQWVIVDHEGKSYTTPGSRSILDEKDEFGRFKTELEIGTYELEEVPEELTLHLVSVTRFQELTDKWKIPLHY